MTRIGTNEIRIRIALLSSIGFIFILLVAYVYFLNLTIQNGVFIQKHQGTLSSINKNISELETQYFSLSQQVTLDKAKELGFAETDKALYVTRNESQKLSLKN